MPLDSIERRLFNFFTLLVFLVNTIGPMPTYAQNMVLPTPGTMVHLSPSMNPPILKGIKVHPDNPFQFEFIMDTGDVANGLKPFPTDFKNESARLIKYFLASLTIPEKDLWVNLSPYEKDRIIPSSFGLTEMGRDLLAEDYMLKQITASLIYPEDEIGKKFWKRIYEEAQAKYGTTNIPVNTFNKVWIIPEKAVVYENGNAGTAYVVESRLKVMLEEDYLSMEKHQKARGYGLGAVSGSTQPTAHTQLAENSSTQPSTNQIGSQIVREIVIPALEREVNTGANFAQLRQVYNSLILATWYKKKIKDSILAQVYADKAKVKGLGYGLGAEGYEQKGSQPIAPSQFADQSSTQPLNPEQIYQRYLQAFKKGVYNYIKEEPDPITNKPIPRKYFSGGFALNVGQAMVTTDRIDRLPTDTSHAMIINASLTSSTPAQLAPEPQNPAMNVFSREEILQSIKSVIPDDLKTHDIDVMTEDIIRMKLHKGDSVLMVGELISFLPYILRQMGLFVTICDSEFTADQFAGELPLSRDKLVEKGHTGIFETQDGHLKVFYGSLDTMPSSEKYNLITALGVLDDPGYYILDDFKDNRAQEFLEGAVALLETNGRLMVNSKTSFTSTNNLLGALKEPWLRGKGFKEENSFPLVDYQILIPGKVEAYRSGFTLVSTPTQSAPNPSAVMPAQINRNAAMNVVAMKNMPFNEFSLKVFYHDFNQVWDKVSLKRTIENENFIYGAFQFDLKNQRFSYAFDLESDPTRAHDDAIKALGIDGTKIYLSVTFNISPESGKLIMVPREFGELVKDDEDCIHDFFLAIRLMETIFREERWEKTPKVTSVYYSNINAKLGSGELPEAFKAAREDEVVKQFFKDVPDISIAGLPTPAQSAPKSKSPAMKVVEFQKEGINKILDNLDSETMESTSKELIKIISGVQEIAYAKIAKELNKEFSQIYWQGECSTAVRIFKEMIGDGLSVKEITYQSDFKTNYHKFLLVKYKGLLWIVDPTWQQYVQKKDEKQKVLVQHLGNLTDLDKIMKSKGVEFPSYWRRGIEQSNAQLVMPLTSPAMKAQDIRIGKKILKDGFALQDINDRKILFIRREGTNEAGRKINTIDVFNTGNGKHVGYVDVTIKNDGQNNKVVLGGGFESLKMNELSSQVFARLKEQYHLPPVRDVDAKHSYEALYLDQDYRENGIGRILMSASLLWTKSIGQRELFIQIDHQSIESYYTMNFSAKRVNPEMFNELVININEQNKEIAPAQSVQEPPSPARKINDLTASQIREYFLSAYQRKLVKRVSLFNQWRQSSVNQKILVGGAVVLRKTMVDGINQWCFLLGKRGEDAADTKGYYSFPVGKVDQRLPLSSAFESLEERKSLQANGIMDPNDLFYGEDKESILAAAARETKQETGLPFRISDFVGRINDFIGDHEGILVNLGVYIDETNQQIKGDKNELTDFIFVPVSTLLNNGQENPSVQVEKFLSNNVDTVVLKKGLKRAGFLEISKFFKQVFEIKDSAQSAPDQLDGAMTSVTPMMVLGTGLATAFYFWKKGKAAITEKTIADFLKRYQDDKDVLYNPALFDEICKLVQDQLYSPSRVFGDWVMEELSQRRNSILFIRRPVKDFEGRWNYEFNPLVQQVISKYVKRDGLNSTIVFTESNNPAQLAPEESKKLIFPKEVIERVVSDLGPDLKNKLEEFFNMGYGIDLDYSGSKTIKNRWITLKNSAKEAFNSGTEGGSFAIIEQADGVAQFGMIQPNVSKRFANNKFGTAFLMGAFLLLYAEQGRKKITAISPSLGLMQVADNMKTLDINRRFQSSLKSFQRVPNILEYTLDATIPLVSPETLNWLRLQNENNLKKLKSPTPSTKEPTSSAMINTVWKTTDISNHDPRNFTYTVKMYFPERLLDPESNNANEYYSASVINQNFMKTIGDQRIGVILDYPEQDLLAILRYMHQDVVVGAKNLDGLKMFLRQHDPSNILYESVFSQNNPLRLTPQEYIDELQKDTNGSPPGYAANNEILIRNSKNLKVSAAVLMAKDGIKMETTLEKLKNSPLDEVMLKAIQKGLPVVIVADQEADLNEARSSFMKAFPTAVEVSPFRFEVKKDGAMKVNPTGGIDLTPANMALQTQNAGDGIKFHLDPAMLKQLQNAPGFTPVIINITPLEDLRFFLGINEGAHPANSTT